MKNWLKTTMQNNDPTYQNFMKFLGKLSVSHETLKNHFMSESQISKAYFDSLLDAGFKNDQALYMTSQFALLRLNK